ncbi:hypothetical protein [Algoriphagus sp. CAU 1675]|uniref:hypothetical protein n=1 Tax=Algoriphagus sp. CAU 1675 TaxID=3032597 RepID=UPI0023D9ABDD|nr:hypothetical protein [Algoriphagus sp. CAU 1675]MDF2158024.1 hypothetical protein [Algoriphagus sp. CAU 1675]
MGKKENILEEYKVLREEIVRLEKEQMTISYYVLGVIIASASAGFTSNHYLLLFLPFIYLIILIWGLERYFIAANLRVKLSSYLEIFIEKELKGINWESRNLHFKKNERWVQNKYFRRFTNFFTLSVTIDLFLIFMFYGEIGFIDSYFLKYILSLVLFILFLIRIVYLYNTVFHYPRHSEYKKKWKEISERE